MTTRNLSRRKSLQLAVFLGGGASASSTSIDIADESNEIIALVDIKHQPELFARRLDYHSACGFDPMAASA